MSCEFNWSAQHAIVIVKIRVLSMTYRKRRYYSENDKRLISKRRKSGASQHDIVRFFSTVHSSIACILSETVGFKPLERKRSIPVLKLSGREEISRSIVANLFIQLRGACRDRDLHQQSVERLTGIGAMIAMGN